jgi:hypothetical protein
MSRIQIWSSGVLPRVILTHQIPSTCEQNRLFAVLLLGPIFIITVVFVAAIIFVINSDRCMHQVKHHQFDRELSSGCSLNQRVVEFKISDHSASPGHIAAINHSFAILMACSANFPQLDGFTKCWDPLHPWQ